jgi:N-glycosylase/DNA lyase
MMTPGPFDPQLLNDYLALNLSLAGIRQALSPDVHVTAAMAGLTGLRILQQEPWECLISFILSQWSSVPRIAGQVEAISRRWGREIAPGAWAFPRPEELAQACDPDLGAMGLGYRAPYIVQAARKCAGQGTEWLDALACVDYRDARELIARPVSGRRASEKVMGVGSKVADCVLLFSLGHYEAFPVDVHVRRAMERWYGDIITFGKSYDSVAEFGRQRFGAWAGYAQQYLFHRQRTGAAGGPSGTGQVSFP